MARRTQKPTVPPRPEMTGDDMRRGITLLGRRLAEVEQMDPRSISEHDMHALESAIDEALERVYGRGTSDYNRYCSAARFDNGPLRMGGGTWGRSMPEDRTHYVIDGQKQSIALLKGALRVLEERLQDEGVALHEENESTSKQKGFSSKIFIVHGHDHAMREAVARFVERVGLEVIILGEQANQGRTIIEKFEAHSSVGFAIALLSADDLGGVDAETLKPRARQNVLLELGYFVGKLNRSRVCALVNSRELELPSDTHGIVWIYWDQPWQLLLAKELRAAGYDVDLNALV